MDITAVRDVAVGISLYHPYRIVAAVELVRGARGDEPTVAALLEGVEVPVGRLNVRTVDLVPLHVARALCSVPADSLDEPLRERTLVTRELIHAGAQVRDQLPSRIGGIADFSLLDEYSHTLNELREVGYATYARRQ